MTLAILLALSFAIIGLVEIVDGSCCCLNCPCQSNVNAPASYLIDIDITFFNRGVFPTSCGANCPNLEGPYVLDSPVEAGFNDNYCAWQYFEEINCGLQRDGILLTLTQLDGEWVLTMLYTIGGIGGSSDTLFEWRGPITSCDGSFSLALFSTFPPHDGSCDYVYGGGDAFVTAI